MTKNVHTSRKYILEKEMSIKGKKESVIFSSDRSEFKLDKISKSSRKEMSVGFGKISKKAFGKMVLKMSAISGKIPSWYSKKIKKSKKKNLQKLKP